MREREFRSWLEKVYPANTQSGDLKDPTVDTHVGRVKSVEKTYGFNLDTEFQKNRLAPLVKSFDYTAEDKRNKRPNPTKMLHLKLTTLKYYKTSLKKYRDFCEQSGKG